MYAPTVIKMEVRARMSLNLYLVPFNFIRPVPIYPSLGVTVKRGQASYPLITVNLVLANPNFLC